MKSLFVRASRPEAVYSSGEIITFTVNGSEIGEPVEYTVSHSRRGTTATGTVLPNKEIRIEAQEPGFMEISLKKRVKSSYLIGKDAKFAQILSYLPQDVINTLVKIGLNARISHNKS